MEELYPDSAEEKSLPSNTEINAYKVNIIGIQNAQFV